MVKKTKGLKMTPRPATAQVVVRKPKAPKARKAQAIPRMYMGEECRTYLAALTHPFSEEAVGARIPEPYATPTVPYKMTLPVQVTTSATGVFDLVVAPHVLATAWSTFSGALTGGYAPTVASADATFTSSVYAGYGIACGNQNDLSVKCLNYRIVAMGVRIKPNTSFTNTSGRIYGAVVPAPEQFPGLVSSGGTVASVWTALDVPLAADGHISGQVVNLPDGFELQTSELLANGGYEITFRPTGASCTSFRSPNVNGSTEGLATYTATVGVAATVDASYYDMSGNSMLLLRGEGLQASTAAITAEIIMHIEGTPNIAASTSTALQPMPQRPARASADEVFQVIRQAAALPVGAPVVDKMMGALQLAGKAVSGLRDRAKNFLGPTTYGLAEKVLGIAVPALGRFM